MTHRLESRLGYAEFDGNKCGTVDIYSEFEKRNSSGSDKKLCPYCLHSTARYSTHTQKKIRGIKLEVKCVWQ